ncbi:hypothetical protein [Nocardia pseudobrasiliensis]|uniref:Uncharacterized protein n=1 Tax=Nocardia pseudobrasiliensis TaxID=45979 RepID=A0A370I4X7_9NOCA|nr:hypothetical protein [Nocardia pseudobrasiliensis]RDI65772.1 hypothetical protein DFR76_10587 [Nocardia pseudobrasiliensis]
MTFPVGNPPDGAFQVGSKFGKDLNKDTAVAIMTGGIKQKFTDVRGTYKDQVEDPIKDKPSLSQVPVGSPMWQSFRANEDTTFPRTQLTFGAASSTSSGGGSNNSHTHSLRVTPDYQPAGHGASYLELGYIQAQRDRTYTEVGFITGGSVTAFGIGGFYIGVYSVDTATGNLTLLNPVSAAVDMKGSFGATNTEYRFNLGTALTAKQGDVFAIGLLQVTALGQTCSSLLCITMNNITPPQISSAFPRKNYCYAGGFSAIPAAIGESALNYNESNKVPFYVLR